MSDKIKKGRRYPDGHWSRPKIEDRMRGDQIPLPIFAAVGHALTSWERSQDALHFLMKFMMNTQDPRTHSAISRLFGSIETISAKISALKAVAEVYFGDFWGMDEVRSPFNSLMQEFTEAGYRRNDIAHGRALTSTIHDRADDGSPVVIEGGFILTAPEYMTARNTLFPKMFSKEEPFSILTSDYRFNAEDIMAYSSKFQALGQLVYDYLPQIRKSPSPHGDMPEVLVQLMKHNPKLFQQKISQL